MYISKYIPNGFRLLIYQKSFFILFRPINLFQLFFNLKQLEAIRMRLILRQSAIILKLLALAGE